jgi:hypothetical protein
VVAVTAPVMVADVGSMVMQAVAVVDAAVVRVPAAAVTAPATLVAAPVTAAAMGTPSAAAAADVALLTAATADAQAEARIRSTDWRLTHECVFAELLLLYLLVWRDVMMLMIVCGE